jgi:uncharacterized protein
VAANLFEQYDAIDVDTHVTEPADLWSSRVSSKHQDLAPRVERVDGEDVWLVGGKPQIPAGMSAMAGFDGTLPSEYPATFDDIDPPAYDSHARLAHMDKDKIHAQVLYPNVGGFGSQVFIKLKDADLKLQCIRAYNDFLVDFSAADSNRLLPMTALPFWNIEQTVAEVKRCLDMGHRGLVFPSQPQAFGMPALADRAWDPLWALAEEAGIPINFHIASDADYSPEEVFKDSALLGPRAHFAFASSTAFVANAKCMGEVIFGGVCHRFPKLNFVSVESCVSWIPNLLETMDWQWHNSRVKLEHPEFDLLPSEYFRRQIYSCFWFEKGPSFEAALELYPDNMMWETDFPHPTSMSPGPATLAVPPSEYATEALQNLSADIAEKALHSNAARVYGL